MRQLFGLAFTLAAVSAAAAQDVSVTGIDVIGKGIYEVGIGEMTPDPSAPTGETATPVTFTQTESTTTIPARIGLDFGAEYRVVGSPDGADVELEIVVIYPEPGLADPSDAAPIHENRFQRTKRIGEMTYVGYGFEEEWELVPGTWTFQIWYDDKKLFDESFTVSQP